MTDQSSTSLPTEATIAFFDFDGTLTTRDTLIPFIKFVVGSRTFYTKLLLVIPILMGYFTKLIPNDVAKEKVIRIYLDGYPIEKLENAGRQFSRKILPSMLRPEGINYLHWHQGNGHQCILVSASLDLYLNPWASMNGVSTVLSTSLQINNGYITGKIAGKNCHGEEKVKRINDFLERLPYKKIYAYGDSPADQPMLDVADIGKKIGN